MNKETLQRFLLRLYRAVMSTGVMSTEWGRNLFEVVYGRYKAWFEVGDIRALRHYLPSGSTVVDVGANVGFFTQRFAQWLSGTGLVIAIEPEASNFKRLNQMIRKQGLTGIVRTFCGVAAEKPGVLKLQVNPYHPGDHKIGSDGVDVPAFTVDGLVAECRASRVSFIKIDVQGAEERVLRGALQTIRRSRPAMLLEIDDAGLRKMGSSAVAVVGLLEREGYAIHRLHKGKIIGPFSLSEVLPLCQDGRYADLLFLPKVTGSDELDLAHREQAHAQQ
jgi:FkbM family methyltransferase